MSNLYIFTFYAHVIIPFTVTILIFMYTDRWSLIAYTPHAIQ